MAHESRERVHEKNYSACANRGRNRKAEKNKGGINKKQQQPTVASKTPAKNADKARRVKTKKSIRIIF